MEKDLFFKCIHNPNDYTLRDKLDIQAEKSKYPYCSILQVLDLMSDKAVNIYNWKERFYHKVAIHLLDNDLLDDLLTDVHETKILTAEDSQLKQQIEKLKNKELGECAAEDFDVIEAINSYQDVLSFKTAPKSVIIEKFLESEGNKKPKSEQKEDHLNEDLAKKTILGKDEIVTETLAVIYEKQSKFDNAIAVYEKLMLKYPEKKSIFANQIDTLKSRLEQGK